MLLLMLLIVTRGQQCSGAAKTKQVTYINEVGEPFGAYCKFVGNWILMFRVAVKDNKWLWLVVDD